MSEHQQYVGRSACEPVTRIFMRFRVCIVATIAMMIVSCQSVTRRADTSPPNEREWNNEAVMHLLAAKRAERDGRGLDAMMSWEAAVRADEASPALRIGYAKALLGVGADSMALDQANTALSIDTAFVDAHRFFSAYYQGQERFTESLPHLESLYLHDPSEEIAWRLVHLYRSLDRSADAKRIIDDLAARPLTGAFDMLRWAHIAKNLDYPESAENIYRRLLERWPNEEQGIVAYAEFLDNQGRLEEAEALYRTGLQGNPSSVDISERFAWMLTGQRRWAEADTAISRVPIVNERDLLQRKAWLSLVLKAEQFEIVTQHIERVFDDSTTDSEQYLMLGQSYIVLDKYERAATAFSQALQRDTTVQAYSGLAIAQLQLRRFADAENTAHSALRRFPDDTRVRFLYGMTLRARGKWDRAAVEFARLVDADGTNVLWMFNWASSLERAGRFDESVDAFRRLLAFDESHAMSLNYLGYMFAERGIHLDEALDMISRAVALEPENSSFLDSMGWVLYQLGRHGEAKQYLEDAIRIDDSSALMHAHLGDINAALGEYAAARAAYERALELEPRDTQVREKIERLPIR